MKKLKAAAAVVFAVFYCGTATAETFKDFGDAVKQKGTASEEELNNGYIPLVPGSGHDMRKVPSDGITRNSATQTLTGKKIDCLNNNCLNFPGGGGGVSWDTPIPTDCIGRVDGTFYNRAGSPAVCGGSVGASVTWNGAPLTWAGVPITGL